MANWRINWFYYPGIWLTAATLIFIGAYGLARSWNLLSGPEIIITAPADGLSLDDDFIQLIGEARRISTLSLNGRQIFTNQVGAFRESLLLLPGYNIIRLEAKDKFGRRVERHLTLVNQKL